MKQLFQRVDKWQFGDIEIKPGFVIRPITSDEILRHQTEIFADQCHKWENHLNNLSARADKAEAACAVKDAKAIEAGQLLTALLPDDETSDPASKKEIHSIGQLVAKLLTESLSPDCGKAITEELARWREQSDVDHPKPTWAELGAQNQELERLRTALTKISKHGYARCADIAARALTPPKPTRTDELMEMNTESERVYRESSLTPPKP